MSAAPPQNCVRSSVAMSGVAALACVSDYDGVPISVSEAIDLSGMSEVQEFDEGGVLVVGRALGYDVVAMEGGYDDLPDVRLPVLVALHNGEATAYGVLYRFDPTEAVVGDPRTGAVASWPRDRFCKEWTGSVVQATPVEAERQALSAKLREMRDPWKSFLRTVGWQPPYGRAGAMLLALVAGAAGVVVASHGSLLDAAFYGLVLVAFATSLWSWHAGKGCARCSRAKVLGGGLPLSQAGAIVYAALLLAPFVRVPALWTTLLLASAVGAHVALVRELVKGKVACPACLVVAVSAALALLLSGLRGGVSWVLAGPVTVGSALAVMAVLPWVRARVAWRSRATAEALMRQVSAEPNESGRVRVVVFKRAGCSACALFEAAVRPALVAMFEDAVDLDERDLGDRPTAAPIVCVVGRKRTVFVGLGQDPVQPILAAVEAASSKDGGDTEIAVIVAS